MVRDGATLVDVREISEWDAGHAPQAVHLPLARVGEAPAEILQSPSVVVVCRSGHRSRSATKQLRDLGIEAVNLSGGMYAWAASGGSVVDGSGRAGRI